MITWMIENWTLLVGGGGIVTTIVTGFRYLPRVLGRLAVIANCEWHRAQGLAREAALELEIDRLEETVERVHRLHGGSDSSGSDGTTPMTRTTIR